MNTRTVGLVVAVLLALPACGGAEEGASDVGATVPPSTQPTLTSGDLAACTTFESASARARTSFKVARDSRMGGMALDDSMTGHIAAVDKAIATVDDADIRSALLDLRNGTKSAYDTAVADARTGDVTAWDRQMSPFEDVVSTFASTFEKRCADGGVTVDVSLP